MKSNYKIYNKQELAKIANDTAVAELNKYKDAIYDRIAWDCAKQALAVTFWTLHTEFGFGKERLARLKKEIEILYKLIAESPEILGQEYKIADIISTLKADFDVDFDTSFFENEVES